MMPWRTPRISDIPSDAPHFSDYPAEIYNGPNAKPLIAGNKESQLYRTRIRAWSTKKPNFAGHYILATWGCGTDYLQITIINTVTGRIIYPKELNTNISINVESELLPQILQFHPNSKLLVVIGMPNEKPELRGISYFMMQDDNLAKVRFIPKP